MTCDLNFKSRGLSLAEHGGWAGTATGTKPLHHFRQKALHHFRQNHFVLVPFSASVPLAPEVWGIGIIGITSRTGLLEELSLKMGRWELYLF